MVFSCFQEFLLEKWENSLTLVERRAKQTNCKSEKRSATPRDSGRGPYVYWHSRATLKLHGGAAKEVARSSRAQFVVHNWPCVEAWPCTVAYRVLISFLSSFWGHFVLAFESIFPKTVLGVFREIVREVFCNQIVGFKIVQEFFFRFNSSLFPESLFLFLSFPGFHAIHVSSFHIWFGNFYDDVWLIS